MSSEEFAEGLWTIRVEVAGDDLAGALQDAIETLIEVLAIEMGLDASVLGRPVRPLDRACTSASQLPMNGSDVWGGLRVEI